jgi:hypothetical protein
LRLIACAVLAGLALPGDANAQAVLTPGGQPNSATVTATADVPFPVTYTAPVLPESSMTVTHDAGAGTLAIDALDLRLAEAIACYGIRACRCYRNQQFRLPAGLRPVATVGTDGRFELTHPVVFENDSGRYLYGCYADPQPAVEATWHAAGALSLDPGTGRLRLSDLRVTVDGTGDIEAAGLELDFASGFQLYEPWPRFQPIGAPLVLTGAEISPGSVAKVFLNTASGPVDVTPHGVVPTATTSRRWEGVLPWPWPLPAPGNHDMGVGFISVHLVRTDMGFDQSRAVTFVLAGNTAHGVPGLRGLDAALSPTSWDPNVAIPNVERVYAPGSTTYAGGTLPHREATVVNVFGADGNCAPAGGVVPTAVGYDWLEFQVPAGCPVGPGAFQLVDTATGRSSNVVSAPLGEPIDISDVAISSTGVTVTGSGFNRLTVVNLFARDGAGTLVNFGGYDAAGWPRIPVTVVDSHTLTFDLPVEVRSGACFVEALNPPFVDFSSSRSRLPGGECTIP